MSFKNIIKDILGFIYFNGYRKHLTRLGNRALIYHAFGMRLKHDTYGISMSINKFKEQINYLSDNYKIIFARNYQDIKGDSVSITIDDGYKDTLDAVDILSNYKIPFTLFITSGFLDKKNYLTTDDVIQISKLSNAEIGSHGCSHNRLGLLNYDQQVSELIESKKILEEIIGDSVYGLSFPHGSHNTETLSILEKSNYSYAMSSVKGINNEDCNKYLLRRIEIINKDTIKNLERKILGYYDYY